MERNEDQKKRIEEEWIEMQKNTVKCRFFSICHLSDPDFLTKNCLEESEW